MKHDELWNDMLQDVLPPNAATTNLEAMRKESRRVHAQRRALRVGSSLAIFIVAALVATLLTPHHDSDPQVVAVPAKLEAVEKAVPHQLSDEELISRLKEADMGIVIANQNGNRRLLIVSHAGAVYPW